MKKTKFDPDKPFRIFSGVASTPLGVVSGLIILVLALITVVDVIARASTIGSVPGALEVSEVLLVVCVFFAFGAAQASGAHVATSVVTERLSARARLTVLRIAAVLVCVMLIALVIATAQEAITSVARGDYRFGLIQVPLWPAKVAVVIGMVVYLVEFVRSYLVRKEIPFSDEQQVELEIGGPVKGGGNAR